MVASVMHWTFPLETGVHIPFLSKSEKRLVTSLDITVTRLNVVILT